MKYILTLIILIISATSSSAGGYYYPVEVIQYELDQTDQLSYTLTIRSKDSYIHSELGPCELIIIDGHYDDDKWQRYERPISKETHMNSLKMLKNAHESKETILFGAMGNGLIQIEDCLYESKGLFIEEYDGNLVVFSVNDGI